LAAVIKVKLFSNKIFFLLTDSFEKLPCILTLCKKYINFECRSFAFRLPNPASFASFWIKS